MANEHKTTLLQVFGVAFNRLAPLHLPLLAMITANLRLATRYSSPYSLENLVYVSGITLILPGVFCVVAGLIVMGLDLALPRHRDHWFAITVTLTLISVWGGYVMGKAVDF